MKVDITTWHLEMTDRAQLAPSRAAAGDLAMSRAEVPCPELNRFLYTAVGGDWWWIDRLPWTYRQWMEWLDRPEVETWVGSVRGTPAGYFELERQGDPKGVGGSVEIAYFGLLPGCIGKGLGGALLTCAAERGFAMGAGRVWVHTCSLDHPRALPAYQARGFRLFRTEMTSKVIPERPPGPWPGAGRERRP